MGRGQNVSLFAKGSLKLGVYRSGGAETVSAEHNKNGGGGAERDRKIRGITPKPVSQNHPGSYKE